MILAQSKLKTVQREVQHLPQRQRRFARAHKDLLGRSLTSVHAATDQAVSIEVQRQKSTPLGEHDTYSSWLPLEIAVAQTPGQPCGSLGRGPKTSTSSSSPLASPTAEEEPPEFTMLPHNAAAQSRRQCRRPKTSLVQTHKPKSTLPDAASYFQTSSKQLQPSSPSSSIVTPSSPDDITKGGVL